MDATSFSGSFSSSTEDGSLGTSGDIAGNINEQKLKELRDGLRIL